LQGITDALVEVIRPFDKDLAEVVKTAGTAAASALAAPSAAIGKLAKDSGKALDNLSDKILNQQKNFDSVRQRIAIAGEVVLDFGDKGEQAGDKNAAALERARIAAEKAREELKKLKDEAGKLLKDINTATLNPFEKLDQQLADDARKLREFYDKGAINFEEFQKGLTDITTRYSQERTKIETDQLSKQLQENEKLRQERGAAVSSFVAPFAQAFAQAGNVAEIDKQFSENQKKLEDSLRESKDATTRSFLEGRIDRKEYEAEISRLAEQGEKERLKIAKDYEEQRQGVLDSAATGLVTTGVSALGDAILPGLGTALSPLVGLFAQGPEATKEAVKGLAEALPVIIEAIAESAPVFVEALIEAFITNGGAIKIANAIVTGTANALIKLLSSVANAVVEPFLGIGPTLAQGITTGFSAATANLGAGILSIIQTLGQTIFNGIAAAGTALFNAVASIGGVIVNSIRDGILSIGDAIINFFQGAIKFEEPAWIEKLREILNAGIGGKSGLGGAGGAISRGFQNIRSGLGFANGGIFKGPDTALTLTRPDEMLLNPRQQSNLFRQLNSGTGASDASLPILLKIASLLEAGMTVETDINIGSDKLATAILNLNRRNARLS